MMLLSGIPMFVIFEPRYETSIAVFAVVLLVFGVLRNLPMGSWLAP